MSKPKLHKIKKGLDLPLSGAPNQKIAENGNKPRKVAILGRDYVGMKPTLLVSVGETVKIGQPLFEDKKNPGVVFTSPAAGEVLEINRGEKRVFESIVIDCSEDVDSEDRINFTPISGPLNKDSVKDILLESGLWTSFRTRPFSSIPNPSSEPSAIFVTAIDSNPLAADPYFTIKENEEDFLFGLEVISSLTKGKVYLCTAPNSSIEAPELSNMEAHEFSGPHPAGLAGTHIHLLNPADEKNTVWSVGYQDVIAIGKLLSKGEIWLERVISLAGPLVNEPRIIRTRLGASISDICQDELKDDGRKISGSPLSGHVANKTEDYLGRYHNQVSVLEEGDERVLLGWQGPGFETFSITNVFVSKLFPGKKIDFTTSTGGSKRAMVPIGMYETVVPIDIVPTYFLRALVSKDLESAISLGALELDEEDLSLCTFVCPGKTDYGPLLRDILTTIQKEG